MPPAKKPAKTPVEPEVTGPSSTPVAPVLTLGPVSAPVVRSGAQVINADVICRALEAFNIWHFTEDQRSVSIVILTGAGALLWNIIEARRGRRLIGAPQ